MPRIIEDQGYDNINKFSDLPSESKGELILEKYRPKDKLFGDRAQRIDRAELNQAIQEVIDIARPYFEQLQATEPLDDKKDS